MNLSLCVLAADYFPIRSSSSSCRRTVSHHDFANPRKNKRQPLWRTKKSQPTIPERSSNPSIGSRTVVLSRGLAANASVPSKLNSAICSSGSTQSPSKWLNKSPFQCGCIIISKVSVLVIEILRNAFLFRWISQ